MEELTQLEDDHFHDECGVFGVFGNNEAAKLTYLGLYALQHRGQESAGIASGGNLGFDGRACGFGASARASCGFFVSARG